jgi:hypothetical protein
MLTSTRSPEMKTLKACLKNIWMAGDCEYLEVIGVRA